MLYGELGRMSLKLIINQRIISFWARIITDKQTKLSPLLHELMLWDSTIKVLSYKLTRNIENIFNNSAIALSPKGKIYAIFKEKRTLEIYVLLHVLPKDLWPEIFKFRTSNHYIPIETGRWNNILVEDRICPLCNKNDIGEEFNYLFYM